MKTSYFWRICLAAAWLLLGMLMLPAQASELRVGSKRFTESYILAQIVAQQAQSAGAATEVRQGLGNTAIVYEALRSGQIDVYAEYTGTIAQEIAKLPATASLADLRQALAPQGLDVGVPLGFNNGYALAMRREQALALGVRSLSDLAQQPQLRLGLSNEFLGRADGWKGLAERYQIKALAKGLDHGLAYEAMAQKQIDVMDIYTTDAKIDALDLVVLTDDQNYFPHYDAVLLYRQDVPQKQAAAWASLQKLQGRISEKAMIHMNAQAELQSLPFEEIARQFLAQGSGNGSAQGAASSAQAATPAAIAPPQSFSQRLWQRVFAPDLWKLTGQHLLLVLVSVGAAALIAIPLGVLLFPHARLRALALGMTPAQRMRLLELPLALPTIFAGIRTACAIAIGTATIAAFIGAGGLGERIVTGLALNDSALMLAGALPAAALALCSELVFELIDHYLRRSRRLGG